MEKQVQENVVDMLTKALEQAKAGEVRSAVLVTLNSDGEADRWGQLNHRQDLRTALNAMAALKTDLVEMNND